jgi:hypothetical protein
MNTDDVMKQVDKDFRRGIEADGKVKDGIEKLKMYTKMGQPRFSEVGVVERFKFWADHHKHLTTLATGSIVLITTFLEKLFTTHVGSWLVATALIGFVTTIVASVASMASLSLGSVRFEELDSPTDTWGFTAIATLVSWGGFLIGIVALTIFALKNLK